MNEPQIIEIGLSNTDTSPKLIVTSSSEPGALKLSELPTLDNSRKKSVNFGPGAEMLMNQNKVSSSPKSDLPLSDINSLELNISEKPTITKEKASDVRNKVFGINGHKKSILKSSIPVCPQQQDMSKYVKKTNVKVNNTHKDTQWLGNISSST